jgi:hypothetical protein
MATQAHKHTHTMGSLAASVSARGRSFSCKNRPGGRPPAPALLLIFFQFIRFTCARPAQSKKFSLLETDSPRARSITTKRNGGRRQHK